MRSLVLVISINLIVAVSFLIRPDRELKHTGLSFPGWPGEIDGVPIYEVGLKPEELRWVDGFPGKISRFTDGGREIVIRWVNGATRTLHPTGDCLKGLGYSVHPARVRQDQSGKFWSCVDATKAGKPSMLVCEHVIDDEGHSWTDTSSWFWAALFNGGAKNYWAISVGEREI